MTNADTKALLEFAGVKAEAIKYYHLDAFNPHFPPLTGDFADVVAMKCLRKLPVWHDLAGGPCKWTFAISDPKGKARATRARTADPADAIFAATLAYLKEQEGK